MGERISGGRMLAIQRWFEVRDKLLYSPEGISADEQRVLDREAPYDIAGELLAALQAEREYANALSVPTPKEASDD